ncbi:MAG: sulfatase, partial [Myxococcales bacterium]
QVTMRIFERPSDRWLGVFLSVVVCGCAPTGDEAAPVEPNSVIRSLEEEPATERPNIVIIVADDLGYGDLGTYGGRAIRTPHIDGLAAAGIRLTDFHASDSVCTPSRAGLLTGRYPKRMGLDVPLMPEEMTWSRTLTVALGYLAGRLGLIDLATEGKATGLDHDEITLAEALHLAGYETGMVGKWHLGDFASNPDHNPLEHGFDFYFGVPYSNDMHPFPLYRGREQLLSNVDDQSILTGRYTEEALRFIESAKDRPFFLYFAHTFPHRPLFASKRFRNRSEGGLFGDAVEEIDWSVGHVLTALEEHGIADNTLVIFTSDNGPWYQGSPGGLRGRKGQSYEGGHRVPFLARWPGHIVPGSVSDAPVMNIDLFPTCLALAGLSLPDDRIIDGDNIIDVLTSADATSPHELLYFYHQGRLEGIRSGKWKYFSSINHYVWPLPLNEKLGGISEHTTGPLPLLFNLELDRDESYDLGNKHPDLAAQLAEQMKRWAAELEANPKGWKH